MTGAALANALWLAGAVPGARRFRRALSDPLGTQHALLRRLLVRHAASEAGRRYDFATIGDVASFARRVPLSTYADLEPDIERVAAGAVDVLTCGRVTHLAPTSGSTGARKLIPFTADLQAAFNAAVNPWMVDLVRQRPAILGGPAYWSISPLDAGSAVPAPTPQAPHPRPQPPGPRPQSSGPTPQAPGPIPIGFADDADYLGGARAWLVRKALAVPSSARHAAGMEAFACLTMLALLRRRDLRLISIWHPSFLDAVLAAAEPHWDAIVDAVAAGDCPWAASLPEFARTGWLAKPDAARAAELRRIGPDGWAGWWPRLQVVSCWGEQAAAPGWRALRDRFPQALVQPKGLLATEGVVTIPLGHERPLAIRSHVFEFLDPGGNARFAHQLERGGQYEVVLTNGAGLWRYRLGDVVECTGFVKSTPTLAFLGRAGRVSDLRGEKLSETFVAQVLRDVWRDQVAPAFAMLEARTGAGDAGYDLVVSAAFPGLEERVETALSANPNYALARRLRQLRPVQVRVVSADEPVRRLEGSGLRLGDSKPSLLHID